MVIANNNIFIYFGWSFICWARLSAFTIYLYNFLIKNFETMVNKSLSQILFVRFPIIFPIIYGLILYSFPNYEQLLILLTILLLAETHFGATWPLFLNKSNRPQILEKKNELIFIPLFIILFSIVGFFFLKPIFFIIFFMANMYHVTRQSYGISKLYSNNEKEFEFQAYYIYLFNFIFFLISVLRFQFEVVDMQLLIYINIVVILAFLIVFSLYLIRFKYSQNFLNFITGCIIFYPACFVGNPIHVIIMGVTMHYSQYLYLTHYIHKSRVTVENEMLGLKNKKTYYYFFIILFYSSVMSVALYFSKTNQGIYENLILIPIIGQFLHFYLDSQLWKFSEKHNRQITLVHLLKIITK